MAALKSVFSVSSQVAALVLLVVVALGSMCEMGEAQGTCSNQLSGLNVCAPYVVPGAPNTNPTADCCGALEAVNHDCLCNTLRIASRLPSLCQIPPFACGAN